MDSSLPDPVPQAAEAAETADSSPVPAAGSTGRRILLSCGLVSGWLMALFTGWALGGAAHLLLVLAIAVFPWRQLPGPSTEGEVAADDAAADDDGFSAESAAGGR